MSLLTIKSQWQHWSTKHTKASVQIVYKLIRKATTAFTFTEFGEMLRNLDIICNEMNDAAE